MTAIAPIPHISTGSAAGGGILSAITGGSQDAAATQAATGVGQVAQAGGSSDGSVGLFDGIWKKAAIFGVAGGVAGAILPFGGPIIGGIMGAISGAAMGVFSNWRKMNAIKQENAATLAAAGVQTGDPQVQQILQSGNVDQLIPLAQQAAAQQSAGQSADQSGGSTPTTAQEASTAQYVAAQQAAATQAVVDPSANAGQSPASSPIGEISPATADPGVAPGGGSLGSSDATAGVTAAAATGGLTTEQMAVLIQQLQQQIDELKAYIAAADKKDAERAQQGLAA